MAAPALGESGVSAGELLFGSVDTSTTAGGDQSAQSADAAQGAETSGASGEAETEEDVYGANDQASISAYKTLQRGDRDDADGAAYIVMLQNRLITLGFLQGAADGVFGESTETAVKQFQKLNGLEMTGIADAETQAKLFSDLSALATPSPENPVVFGSDALRVQTKLAEWGFLLGSVDGKIGTDTEKAIIRFKTYVNSVAPQAPTPSPTPSPSPTPEPTLAPGELPAIVDALLPTVEPAPTPYTANSAIDDTLLAFVDGERSFEVYFRTVQSGDQNEDVYRVQIRLKQLNYLYDSPDGAFGANTQLALKYFQRKHGLTESGIADEATQRALFSSSAQKAEEYVFPYKILVDISDQRVYVFKWDGEAYTGKERMMICSTGKDATPTPTGTYQAYGRMTGEWYYFKTFNCYAKWAYGIVGGILFHSVTYSSSKKLNQGSVNNLGRKASHGCIRLKVEDAKWIYENCPNGTTVVIRK